GPVACLRVLQEADGDVRIGRVATAPSARHRGLAAALIGHAIAMTAPAPVVLGGQRYLADWYQSLGFAIDGPDYVEGGIPHVPMRLNGGARGSGPLPSVRGLCLQPPAMLGDGRARGVVRQHHDSSSLARGGRNGTAWVMIATGKASGGGVPSCWRRAYGAR